MEEGLDESASGQTRDELFINENQFSWLSDLYENRLGVDFTIVIGDKVIHGHKNILSAAIPYFTALFSTRLTEQESGKVVLKDIDPDATEMIIGYVYTGKLKIHRDNWQALLMAADFLQVKQITDHCCDYLEKNLNIDRLFRIKNLPILTNSTKLLEMVDNFILENFERISKKNEFLDLPFDEMMNIISRDELKIQSELNTFMFLMNWIKHDLQARKPNLAQLFTEIRLHLISKEDLIKFISREPLITEDKECNEYLYRALSYHILPGERKHSRDLWTRTRNHSRDLLTGSSYFGEEIMHILRGDNQTRCRPVMEKLKLEPFSTEIQEIPHPITFNITALLDNKLYLIGDLDEYEATNRVFVLDLHTREYSGVASMNYARKRSGAVVIGDKIYVCGGLSKNMTVPNSVECFSPSETSGTTSRYGSSNTTIVYDPNRGTWVLGPSMVLTRHQHHLVNYRSKLYAIGGKDDSGNYVNSIEELKPESAGNGWRWIEVEKQF